MNFFFKRKLKQQIREAHIPVREEFFSTLRTSLVNRAEKDRRQSFITTMKLHKRAVSLAIVPLGIAIAIVSLQMTRSNTPGVNGVLNIPQVLAESIANTFQFKNSDDFTHHKIHIKSSMGEYNEEIGLDTWKYKDNSRMNLLSPSQADGDVRFDYLISAIDNQACVYVDLPDSIAEQEGEYTFGGAAVQANIECDETIEVNMAMLQPGELAVGDLHIVDATEQEKEENPGAAAFIVWSSAVSPQQMGIGYSRNNSGYSDAGGVATLVGEKNGVYTYRDLIYPVEPRTDEIHIGDYNTQLVQFTKLGDTFSAIQNSQVYELHLAEKTVQQISGDTLAALQTEYKLAVRGGVLSEFSPEGIYNRKFGLAIEIKDQLASLTPIVEQDEEYHGQRAVRVRYALTDDVKSQEAFDEIAEIEFVIDVQHSQILAYTLFDGSGNTIEQVSVEVSEVVTGVDPQTFFSLDHWKKEIGAE